MKYLTKKKFIGLSFFFLCSYLSFSFWILYVEQENINKNLYAYLTLFKSQRLFIFLAIMLLPVLFLTGFFLGKIKTDLLKAEENQRFCEILFKNNLNILYDTDKNGRITAINETVLTILGYSSAELIGKNINQLFLSSTKKPLPAEWTGAKKEAVCYKQSFHKDGHCIHLEVRVAPRKKKNGTIIGYMGAAKDITHQKNYISQLEVISKRYTALFELNSHFAFIINKDGIIMEMNKKGKETIGGALIGSHFMEVIYEKEKSFASEGFKRVLKGETVENFDIIQHKNGCLIHVEYKSSPIIINNVLEGAFLVFKDITDIKQLKEIAEKDIKVATIVQQSVLSSPLKTDYIDVSGHYIPAHNISGDMYAWYPIDKFRYGIIILDVMGHGVSAALISMSIHSLLEGLITKHQDPSLVTKRLNRHMYNLFNVKADSLRYFTAIYLVVDTIAKKIEYVNAGHPPGLLLGEQGSQRIKSNCTPLGLLPEIEPSVSKLNYQNPSQIILYTDGLLGHMNTESVHTAAQKIEKEFLADTSLACAQFVDQLMAKSDVSEQDDLSILKVNLL